MRFLLVYSVMHFRHNPGISAVPLNNEQNQLDVLDIDPLVLEPIKLATEALIFPDEKTAEREEGVKIETDNKNQEQDDQIEFLITGDPEFKPISKDLCVAAEEMLDYIQCQKTNKELRLQNLAMKKELKAWRRMFKSRNLKVQGAEGTMDPVNLASSDPFEVFDSEDFGFEEENLGSVINQDEAQMDSDSTDSKSDQMEISPEKKIKWIHVPDRNNKDKMVLIPVLDNNPIESKTVFEVTEQVEEKQEDEKELIKEIEEIKSEIVLDDENNLNLEDDDNLIVLEQEIFENPETPENLENNKMIIIQQGQSSAETAFSKNSGSDVAMNEKNNDSNSFDESYYDYQDELEKETRLRKNLIVKSKTSLEIQKNKEIFMNNNSLEKKKTCEDHNIFCTNMLSFMCKINQDFRVVCCKTCVRFDQMIVESRKLQMVYQQKMNESNKNGKKPYEIVPYNNSTDKLCRRRNP